METYEKFTNYIAGTLSPEEEQKLFSEMNFDDELRSQFRRYVSIEGAFKQTASAFIPPTNVTGAIYNSLGFTMPNIAEPISAATQSFFGSHLFSALTTGLLSAILGVVVTFWFINPGKTGAENLHSKNSIQAVTTFDQSDYSNTPVNKIKSLKFINNDNSKNPSPNAVDDNIISKNLNPDKKITQSNLVNILLPEIKLLGGNSDNIENKNSLNEVKFAEETDQVIENNNHKFSFGFQNSLSWNLPKETIEPYKLSKLNNMGISLYYNYSNQIKIGVDLRQETFFVRYSGSDTLQRILEYEQQPNLTSAGVFVRYLPFEDYYGFQPEFQLGIGLNYYGIFGRSNTGIIFNATDKLKLIAQAEFSRLFFKHRSFIFFTEKIALNYGIIYNF